MRMNVAAIAMGALLLAARSGSAAPCSDTAAVAAARAAADAACDAEGSGCTSATVHGQYVSCIARQTSALVKAGSLPRECKGAVKKCAAKSTCGKEGFVTCCRTKVLGDGTSSTKCSVKRNASLCTAPPGGSACAGTRSSCCDACGDTGCASPSGAFVDGF